jgi:hypothetical protein
MFTTTGYLKMVFTAPAVVPDATTPGGLRREEQITLAVQASSDEQEYQFTMPITEQTIAVAQLEEWQAGGKAVTVFASSLRAISFTHDTRKDEEGNPIKRYRRAGRKVQVGEVTVETDAFLIGNAYEVRLAGSVDLDQEAQKAHGEYMKRQALYRQRQVQLRVQQAEERVRQRLAEAEAKAKAEATAASGTGTGAKTETRRSA